jgi:hypothetical protein
MLNLQGLKDLEGLAYVNIFIKIFYKKSMLFKTWQI